ncbi:MAG: FG-GAP-like repeat-containing protein [Ignavibacteria bacterium]
MQEILIMTDMKGVLIGLSNSNTIFIYNGSQNKGFNEPADQIYHNSTYEFGYSVSGAGDVNSDGYDDISIGSRGGIVFAFFGSSNGIANTPDWTDSGLFNYYGYVTSSAGDFNNDGYGDISVDNNSGNANVFYGSSSGLNNIPLILICNSYHLSYGDINGDNISDILTFRDGRAYGFYGSTDTSGIINYILNTVPGINSNNVNRSTDVSIVFNRDMNSSSLNSSNIKVYAEYSGIQNAILTYDSLLKKLTIDPFEDFIAGEKINVTITSGVKTFENMNVSPFSFSFTTEATGGSARFAITDSIEITGSVNIADIDSDGDIDILVGNNTLNSMQQVKIYKNDGSGHFSYFTDVQGAYQSFTVADFDTDGDPDILSEAENDQVRLFLNDGLGNFSPSIVSGGFTGIPADLDNDGDPDIARSIQEMM